MSADPGALVAYLWPHGDDLAGPQVHLLLDGARDPGAAAMIRFGKLEYSCLFSGRLTPRLQAAAPYLVHLSARSPLTRELLARTWGNSAGILTVARPDVTLEQQRRHFKKFLRVQDEDGRVLQFRFYDPRVLRVYLPTCTAEELQRFFGPVSRIVMEPQAGAAPLDYALQFGALAPGRNVLVPDASRLQRSTARVRGSTPDIDIAGLVALDLPGHGAEALDVAPLGLHHAQAYRKLQNDEEIRRWTGLPLHASVEDARQWIREQLRRADAGMCVIRHPDHGIVGALMLEQRGSAALGFCWMGRDFQRRGYGRAALRLLGEFAAKRGVRRLYASVAPDNAGWSKLVRRAGGIAIGGDDLRGMQFMLPLRVGDGTGAGALAPQQLLQELALLRPDSAGSAADQVFR